MILDVLQFKAHTLILERVISGNNLSSTGLTLTFFYLFSLATSLYILHLPFAHTHEIKLLSDKKTDSDELAHAFMKAFNQIGDSRTKKSAKDLIKRRLATPSSFMIKVKLADKIIGGFMSDIKPTFYGNILYNGEIFILPRRQNKGIGKQLLYYSLDYAKKHCNAIERTLFTPKDSYEEKRYKRLGFKHITTTNILEVPITIALKKLSSKN